MKSIAGPLRTEFAQYRELAAFAQFGSDLSKDTLERLRQGERIVEMLKQPQYAPIPVEQQVLVMYVLINGHLSDVYVERVRDFEHEFLVFIDDHHSEITDEIRNRGKISEELEEKIKAAINEFKQTHTYH